MSQCSDEMQLQMEDVVERKREEAGEGEGKTWLMRHTLAVAGKRRSNDGCQATIRSRIWQEPAATLRKVESQSVARMSTTMHPAKVLL